MKQLLHTIKRIFNQISQIGFEDDLPYLDKVRVRFMNQGAVFIILVTGFFMLDAFRISASCFWLNVFLFASGWPVLLLNYLKKHQFARFYMVGVFPLLIISVFVGFGRDIGIEYVYFVLILAILVLYKSNWARAGFIFFILLIQAAGTYYTFHFPVWYEEYTVLSKKTLILVFSMITLAAIIIELYNEVEKRMEAQRRLNIQLQQKNKELLERAAENENKLQLFSILAHDLRKPISSFHDLSEKISFLIKKGDHERMVEFANLYEKSGREVSYIMDNLLKWVISQKEGIQLSYQKIKPFEVILEIEKEVQIYSELKNIRFEINFKPETQWITDLNILKIILSNIIHNAVKFSQQNGKILISNGSRSDFLLIKIQDFGIGMSSDTVQEIQSNLYNLRLGNFTTGHGLGLKSCFALIKHLNGKIEIESELGKGSTFSICLPKIESISKKSPTKKVRLEEELEA